MSDKLKFEVRSASVEDEPFLREMLLETLFSEEDGEEYTMESLEEPSLARYISGFGKAEGDFGFIAHTEKEHLGGVWCRLWSEGNEGYGFVDYETPELAIAIMPAARGMGVGSVLMKTLLDYACERYPGICLSVAPNNPAKRLYERFGFETVEVRGTHPIMVHRF